MDQLYFVVAQVGRERVGLCVDAWGFDQAWDAAEVKLRRVYARGDIDVQFVQRLTSIDHRQVCYH
jgi:hypothetical protein